MLDTDQGNLLTNEQGPGTRAVPADPPDVGVDPQQVTANCSACMTKGPESHCYQQTTVIKDQGQGSQAKWWALDAIRPDGLMVFGYMRAWLH